jgi:hypothetical protein
MTDEAAKASGGQQEQLASDGGFEQYSSQSDL